MVYSILQRTISMCVCPCCDVSDLPCQHRLDSSIVLKSTTAYTLFIKMILHLKSSGITSMSYVQTIYNHFTRLYTDGSKMGDGIDLAVVWQKSCKTVRLPNNASIFGAMLCAISLVLNIIRHWRDMDLSSSLTLCLVCRLRAGLNSK